MSDGTAIEWTDATWQPITGCSVLTPGCTNCYAMKLAGTRLRHHPSRKGLTIETKAGPVWNGEVRFNEQWLLQPLAWRKPRKVFVCAHGDLFHESIPDEWIDKVFAVMALCPQHTFQVLTKRAKRMREYFDPTGCVNCGDGQLDGRCCDEPAVLKDGDGAAFRDAMIEGAAQKIFSQVHPGFGEPSEWLAVHMPLPNVWLGVSTERQQEADERIPELLQTPAAVRFISAEPLLGPIDLNEVIPNPIIFNSVHGMDRLLDWVIVGGESGNDARPMHPDWARSLRDQCAAAGVNYFFKQWGNWHPEIDRDRDDPDWRQPYANYKEPHFQILNLAGGRGFHGDRVHVMRFCSKKSAGRKLDGVEHNAMPERAVL